MGMFDYVECCVPIDGVENPRAIVWQTKDFDMPCLDSYRITANGRLEHEVTHREDRSDPNAEGLMRFRGMLTAVHDGWEDLNYHGDIGLVGGIGGKWAHVTARFTDGRLTWIRLDAPPAPLPQSAVNEPLTAPTDV